MPLEGSAKLNFPYKRFGELYNIALHSLLLHTPEESYAGPYTYKRFWFRDAAFIIDALLSAGMEARAERIINTFFPRQNSQGYFLSQQGEWDSNGEALWSMMRFCRVSGRNPPVAWKEAIEKGASWISQKRLPADLNTVYAGLFPPGFSAEHLGPNDYYYWDDFWGVAGLRAASWMLERLGDSDGALRWEREGDDFLSSIEISLKKVAGPMRRPIMPASPFRRPDTGAVGSLSGGYPLGLLAPRDRRLLLTAEYLLQNCMIDNAFYHDISHSGINPYLTLHIAQVLMRGSDLRFAPLMEAISSLASPTGQWPEAIHPRLNTGCMGDGQHVWAAAEWTLIVRNSLLREEYDSGVLVFCSGIYKEIIDSVKEIHFGPVPTGFGPVNLHVKMTDGRCFLEWDGLWHEGREPQIHVSFPGKEPLKVPQGATSFEVPAG